MSILEFPDPDEVIREADERDREGERGEHDEEVERERDRGDGGHATDEGDDAAP